MAAGGKRRIEHVGVEPMPSLHTAILHLHEAGPPLARELIESILRPLRGVSDVDFLPTESLVTVRYDDRFTGLAEIVRSIEDLGSVIASVAQRPVSRTV